MADTNTDSSKKSGFSFRKKRSTSKTRKEEAKPVDLEAERLTAAVNESELQKTEESHQTEAASETPLKEQSVDAGAESEGGEATGAVSCGEESSPKGLKSDASPPPADDEGEVQTKHKKTKTRRSRSLFKRSSKNRESKSAERNAEKAVPKKDEPVSDELARKGEVTTENHDRDEDVRPVSDTEYCNGEAIETDGEFAGEDDEDDGMYLSGYETGDETKASGGGDATKKEEDNGKSGSKKKGFFKRGLSLRRSKAKKKRRHSESDVAEKEPIKDNEAVEKPTTILKAQSCSFATQTENPEGCKEESETATNGTEATETEKPNSVEKKPPQKPARRVSFAAPPYEDSEGDSLTGEVPETGNDSEDTPTTSDEIPTENPIANPEVDPEVKDAAPEVITETDEASKISESFADVLLTDVDETAPNVADVSDQVDEAVPEVDDDELTEVSSLAASTDLAPQVCNKMPEPFVFTGTEESGSRITLLESGEIGEGSGLKVDEEEESRPEKDEPEAEKLIEENQEEEKVLKDVEWVKLQKSCDMSGELSRVRKHTLFSVKRLCCSVM